uniref:Dimethylargininase n=1 Tax=Aplanochytrium stocchinoi TaxID=215587 RepID=A0A6S8C7D5_9STRA
MKIFCVYPASKECLKVYRNELTGIQKFLKSLFDATKLSIAQSGDTLKVITDDSGLSTLKALGIENECIISGKLDDIWIRDFGLVSQAVNGEMTRFIYSPKSLNVQDAKEIQKSFDKWINNLQNTVRIHKSILILDGGNVIMDPVSQRAFVTERIFSDNKNFPRVDVVKLLSEELKLRDEEALCVIPEDPEEAVLGHADGCIALVSQKDVVINCENERNMEYNLALRKKIQQSFSDINIHTLPFSPEDKVYRTPGN